ncbi:DsbA family oxidoreductase [Brevibacillus sp. TJ4]|uniref:DsbA family oxidoreductase n=1 Tax=Brevibacillus sp. TJ4 TaxID=3234853 RepID=UPI0037CE0689
MIVEIFQDTVCPWCRIGKKHLFDAISQWTGEEIHVRYRSYQLNAQVPVEGMPFRTYMGSLKGGPQVVEQMLEQVTRAGEAAGLAFHFDKVEKMPNTLLSHQLIKSAPEELQGKIVDAIYKAYFEEGRDIGERDVLLAIAKEAGLDDELASEALQAGRHRDDIQADISFAQANQITGVPFFVLDGKLGLSGAHPVENFLKAFRQVTEQSS